MQYDLKDRVIIVTGANSGIGKAASIQLAKFGAVDLSSRTSIRQFVTAFRERYGQLHVLIHNAANFDHTQKKLAFTVDGFETVFATNHLGPFLMTYWLLDLLKTSAPSRVITVASKGLISYPFLDIEFDNLNGERKFNLQHAYYHSKQAQVMFTFDLAARLRETGVSVHCVRVGNVAIPNERLALLPTWMLRMYAIKRRFSMTPEKMAETYVWLAADPVTELKTGGYWDAPGVEVRANKNAYNKETQERLWAVSRLLTGVYE